MKRDYYVYCHTTPSGRRYIGISNNPVRRWNKGKGYAKNTLFARAIKKYGWDNIQHEILFKKLRPETAQLIEHNLIDEMKLANPSRGLNLREGGDGCFTEHSKHLMSLSRKGNKNCVGRVLSAESKAKISESLKKYYSSHEGTFTGKHHSKETIPKLRITGVRNPNHRAVRQLSMDGTFIRDYDYISLAARELNLDVSSIVKCCKGKIKSHGGFRWEYI